LGVLALHIDGLHARAATLVAGRVRESTLEIPLAVAHGRDGSLVAGLTAAKRLQTRPGDGLRGLGLLLGSGSKSDVGRLLTSRVGLRWGARVSLGDQKVGATKLAAVVLEEVLAQARASHDAERIVLVAPDAWKDVASDAGCQVASWHTALVTPRGNRAERLLLVDVGERVRAAIVSRAAHESLWNVESEASDPEEGAEAVAQRVVDVLHGAGRIVESPASFGALREAADVLLRDARTTDPATYPLPYSALGGEAEGMLCLSSRDADAAYDRLLRRLRRMLLQLRGDADLDGAILVGTFRAHPAVARMVAEIAAVDVTTTTIAAGAACIPPERVTEAVAPRRARPAPPRRSGAVARVPGDVAPESRSNTGAEVEPEPASPEPGSKPAQRPPASQAPPPKSEPARPPTSEPARPPTNEPARPRTSSRRERASASKQRSSVAVGRDAPPTSGTLHNPTSPAALLATDLSDPAHLGGYLAAIQRARVEGVLRITAPEQLEIPVVSGRIRPKTLERAALERLFSAPIIDYELVDADPGSLRLRNRVPLVPLLTDGWRKLSWTFDAEEFGAAMGERMDQAPECRTDEVTLRRMGLRDAEVRVAVFGCNGSEVAEGVVARAGAGRGPALFVLALLEIHGYVAWHEDARGHAAEDPATVLARRAAKMSSGNHFEALGVHWSATVQEIRAAYGALGEEIDAAREVDAELAAKMRAAADAAFEVLLDEDRRIAHRLEAYPNVDYAAVADIVEQQAGAASIRGGGSSSAARRAREISRTSKRPGRSGSTKPPSKPASKPPDE